MRIAAILAVLAMAAVSVRAQAPAAKPGSVEGVVTNSATGEPVKKVVVTLWDKYTAMTDAAGHFHFDSVPPGVYGVTADKDGFQATAQGPRQQVTVAEEQHVHDVGLKLVPLATVSGHVFDDDGDPIPRAQVAVLRYFYGPGRKRLTQVAFAQANDLGEFEVLNLPPGRYYFQVTAAPPRNIPPRTRWTHPEEAYPVTFYPNGREAGQATAIDAAAGAHLINIDFRLRKIPAYHVRGRVSDETAGQPGAEGRVVVLMPESDIPTNLADSGLQSDGGFDLRGLVNGSYAVSCIRFASGEGFSAGQTVLVSDADVNGVALARKPSMGVSGTVTVEGTQPDHLGVQVALTATRGMGQGRNSSVGADGSFAMANVPPQVYQLQIFNVPPGKYVKSIRFGDREIDSGEIDLTERPSAALNIVLGEDGGEVDGTVQTASGQPAASTQILLAPAEEHGGRSDLLKPSQTDASGNFQIKDVAPGEYKVFAWESDPDGSTQSAEFRKPFESKSAAVTVGPKDKASVQLSVITADDMAKERSNLP
jgi:Carboxypeptidase regulatory-like domain